MVWKTFENVEKPLKTGVLHPYCKILFNFLLLNTSSIFIIQFSFSKQNLLFRRNADNKSVSAKAEDRHFNAEYGWPKHAARG